MVRQVSAGHVWKERIKSVGLTILVGDLTALQVAVHATNTKIWQT